MSDIAIKAENISKLYRLGEISTGTVSHDLNRWLAKIRGKEDPFARVGEVNDRTQKGSSNFVWSLKDINFEVRRGESVGIVGKNGAGKSTLLKLLSRVTAPTSGSIQIRGRIASLLEVGTGFHPELTGKENIYLNGTILGMRKKEIDRKLDEIIDFSGVERYIDTPVKRYSSGMYVRLAFAVAAHLEPDILIIDEVLAVGDIEFQKKCLGKMQDVSVKEGRTVLFVSHNMAAISTLCQNVILLKNGMLKFSGKTEEGLAVYMNSVDRTFSRTDLAGAIEGQDDDVLKFLDLELTQESGEGLQFVSNEEIKLTLKYRVKQRTLGLRIGCDVISREADVVLFRTFHDDAASDQRVFEPGEYASELIINANLLKEGNYVVNIVIGIHNVRWLIHDEIKVNFSINNIRGLNSNYADSRPGVIMPYIEWNTNKLVHE